MSFSNPYLFLATPIAPGRTGELDRAPAPANRPRAPRPWLWLLVAGLVAIGLVAIVGAIVAGSAGPRPSSGPSPADGLAEATGPAVDIVPAPVDPSPVLEAFGEAWTDGDWDRMATLADDDVVEVAREWHTVGGEALLEADRLDALHDSCQDLGREGTSCQMLYAPPGGFGLIFAITYAPVGDGIAVVDLVFEGDAG